MVTFEYGLLITSSKFKIFLQCKKIRKEKEAIFSMNIKLACINANGRATRIPSIVRERMSNMKILKGEV